MIWANTLPQAVTSSNRFPLVVRQRTIHCREVSQSKKERGEGQGNEL
jgi:hypothetical protein